MWVTKPNKQNKQKMNNIIIEFYKFDTLIQNIQTDRCINMHTIEDDDNW